MKTEERISQLEDIHSFINVYEGLLAQTMPDWYEFLGPGRWDHHKGIQKKCLAYWKRRFNRQLDSLRYE